MYTHILSSEVLANFPPRLLLGYIRTRGTPSDRAIICEPLGTDFSVFRAGLANALLHLLHQGRAGLQQLL